MCSIGDDNIEDLENEKYMPAKEKLSSSSSLCNKCREGTPIVVLRSKDKYCKECFLSGTVHKFKALLGKHKLIRPNDRILVVHRCGHPSTALLHFIRTGLDLQTHKKLRFEPIILFIEDHLKSCLKDRQQLLQKVEAEVVSFNFPIYITSMAQLISKGVVEDILQTKYEYLELCDDDNKIMDDFVKAQLNVTSTTDFLNITRQNFLIDIAKYLNCKFIFTPEISSDVASQLLTDISLGRGSHISLSMGFCDSRDDTVKILRPLRLFDIKEVAFYNHLNHIEPVTFKVSPENAYKSIQQLMRKFVSDLQANYPATVTTILKTGDKLSYNAKNSIKCDLCKACIEDNNLELNSAESTKFSHWVSTQSSDIFETSQEQLTNTLQTFKNISCANYCYTCKKLIK